MAARFNPSRYSWLATMAMAAAGLFTNDSAFGQGDSLSKLDQHVCDTLAADAKQANNPANYKAVGSSMGKPFLDTYPGGGILVGFDVWEGNYGGMTMVIRGIRPIFQTSKGIVRGKNHGNTRGNPDETIQGKDGYAVAGLEARSLDAVDGFKVIFWKILPFDGSLEADGSYKSDWVGGEGGEKSAHPISSEGRAVIGIVGGSDVFIHRLGLVFAPQQ